MNNLGVAMPGVVVSYSNGRATVRPGVHRLVPSMHDEEPDVVEELPPIQDVPVCWLAGRGVQVAPGNRLQPGDPVLLICLDRDASGWRRSGEPAEPDDARLHDWSHAVAIPGLLPDTSPFTEPTDAPALGSKLDTLIGIMKGWTPVTNDGGAALKAAVTAAFPNIPTLPAPTPTTVTTTKSNILKLES